jgi:hypothetical protein
MSSATATLDALIGRVGNIGTPFAIELPDGEKQTLGEGTPDFCVSRRGRGAASRVDEAR